MRRMKIRPTCRRPFDLIFARAKNGAWRAQRVSKARAECGHTDNHYFADSLTNVANLRAVVAHVLQRTHLSKVNLVGWSSGGPVIGMYATEPANASVLYLAGGHAALMLSSVVIVQVIWMILLVGWQVLGLPWDSKRRWHEQQPWPLNHKADLFTNEPWHG